MQKPFTDSCWDCDGEEGASGSFHQWRPKGSPTIVPYDLGWRHFLSEYENKSPNGMTEEDPTRPLHELSKSLALPGQDSEPHGQFGASSVVVSIPFTKPEKAKSGDLVRDASVLPNTDGLGPNQTGVADHSVDRTAWTWKKSENCHFSQVVICHSSPEGAPLAHEADGFNESLHEYFGSNQGSDLSSEMHEDTAEIDALLYSDDDTDSSVESEVVSTGHSPCMLTDSQEEQIQESVDGVLTSAEPSRNQKRKLHDDADSAATSLTDTASYAGLDPSQNKTVFHKPTGEVCSVDFFPDSRKRMRWDAICQAVSIFEKIVPGPKGKSTVASLDDAIQYVESMRAEARSLGFS